MAEQTRTSRIVEELTDYFLNADADAGFGSSWGALVAIAQGEAGGGDPEARVINRLDRRRRAIQNQRIVHRALAALPPPMLGRASWVDVLWAAHGGVPWDGLLRAAFDPEVAAKVRNKFGHVVGVALLTGGCLDGFANAPAGRLLNRAAWQTPGGFLVSLCHGKAKDEVALGRVKREALGLLAEGEGLYADARGWAKREQAEPRERKPRGLCAAAMGVR
jgi:hypothetical protein